MGSIFDYNLPDALLKGLAESKCSKLFKWQEEVLGKDGVLDGSRNLLYSAPTSAGKTLVSDIIVGRRVSENKKVMRI